jgi:hypothetical protein
MKRFIIGAAIVILSASTAIAGNKPTPSTPKPQPQQTQRYMIAENQRPIGEVCQCSDGTTCAGYGRIDQTCKCTTFTGNIRVTHWGSIVPLNR